MILGTTTGMQVPSSSSLPERIVGRPDPSHKWRRLLLPARDPLQSFKPRQDRRIRTPRRESSARGLINGLCLFDGLSLHLEIDSGVAVSGGDTGVAKPIG